MSVNTVELSEQSYGKWKDRKIACAIDACGCSVMIDLDEDDPIEPEFKRCPAHSGGRIAY